MSDEFIVKRLPIIYTNTGTVDQLLNILTNEKYDCVQYIFYCNEKKHLKGYIPIEKLLGNKKTDKIKNFICTIYCISIDNSLEDAANLAGKKNLAFIPVKNRSGEFTGILSSQTLLFTLRKEHTDDLHVIAGIRKARKILNQSVKANPLFSVKHRLPWLLVGMAGSFLATYIVSRFEKILAQHISLTFFIPGIVYITDAIGTQTETITIRGMSLNPDAFKKNFSKELLSGGLTAFILGILSFVLCTLFHYELKNSFVVSLSIFTAGILATGTGLLLPWILKKSGNDPAYGSGPMATIIQDMLSILVYLATAEIIYRNI